MNRRGFFAWLGTVVAAPVVVPMVEKVLEAAPKAPEQLPPPEDPGEIGIRMGEPPNYDYHTVSSTIALYWAGPTTGITVYPGTGTYTDNYTLSSVSTTT